MANKVYQNPHAQRERELANLIAQETLQDIFEGNVETYNGPALLVGCAFVVMLLGVVAALIIYFL